jgi:hypothetical protein
MRSTMRSRICVALALWASLWASAALADDGHNHGAAPAAAAGPALPRFVAESELFELVGVLNGTHLTLYLDRFGDNAPVKGATVALEIGGKPVALKEHADGEFEGTLAEVLAPGVTPVTATIQAGGEADLLAGAFDVHDAPHGPEARVRGWATYAAGGSAAAALVLLAIWMGRRVRLHRTRVGGAA